MNLNSVSLAIATTTLLTIQAAPAFAQATNPGMRLQYSEITGIDNKVYIYGIPTTDSAGNRKTYDAVVELSAMGNGAPATSAIVTPSVSPGLTSGKIVAGTYKSSAAGTCKVTNFALRTGRVQSLMQCVSDNGTPFEMSAVTGTIGAGHPFEAQLKANNFHLRGDVNAYTWGAVTKSGSNLGACGGFTAGDEMAVQQVGNQILVYLFFGASLDCTTTLTKNP